MASSDLLAAFAIAALTYAMVPGPGTVYVAAQAVARDPAAAVRGALGLHVGGYVMVFSSAAGLTALFAVVPVLYEALRLLGAVFLVWLGIQMIASRSEAGPDGRRAGLGRRRPRTFSQGVLLEILNPTTAIFYVAFLPQFVDPAGDLPVWLQFVVLGVAVNVIFSIGDVVVILLATKAREKVTGGECGRRMIRWLGGSVLIGLGLRLAADRS